jgi:hypothetical protein
MFKDEENPPCPPFSKGETTKVAIPRRRLRVRRKFDSFVTVEASVQTSPPLTKGDLGGFVKRENTLPEY